MTDTSHQTVPVAEMLERLSGEMTYATEACESLQELVSRLVMDGVRPDAYYMQELQRLDRLTQTLANLDVFVREIADDLPESQLIDMSRALSRLSLKDLAFRLEKQEPLNGNEADDDEDHIDFFAEL